MLKLIMALATTGAGLGVMLLVGMLFLRHALNDWGNREQTEERGTKKLDGYERACLGCFVLLLMVSLLGAAMVGQWVCERADSRTEHACGR